MNTAEETVPLEGEGGLAEVTARLAGVGLEEDGGTCQLEPSAPAVCPPLPANVLSLIGRHLNMEERLLAGGTCKVWRSGLHEGITLLEYQLDDGSCAEARRHTCQGWAALLAAAGAVASPTATRARVGLSGNLMTSASVSALMAGLASHKHLQHLSIMQAPHRSGHTLPARTRAVNGRLRRRARWARPPFTVFPSISSREMFSLCSRLTRLVSLSLRECIFLAGFDSWLHDLRSLQRLELVPTQEFVCQQIRDPDKRGRVHYYYARQMRFCLSPSSWPTGRSAASLTSLTLGACLASPADLSELAARLPQLKALRLEAVPLDEYARSVFGPGEGATGRLQRELGRVLRERFSHLQLLDVVLCFAVTLAANWTVHEQPGPVRIQQLRGLIDFLAGLVGADSALTAAEFCNGQGTTAHGGSCSSCWGANAAAGGSSAPRPALRLAGSYDVLVEAEAPGVAALLARICDPDRLKPRVVVVGGRRYGVMAEVDPERVAAGLAAWLPLSEEEEAWQRARVEAAEHHSFQWRQEAALEAYVRRWFKR